MLELARQAAIMAETERLADEAAAKAVADAAAAKAAADEKAANDAKQAAADAEAARAAAAKAAADASTGDSSEIDFSKFPITPMVTAQADGKMQENNFSGADEGSDLTRALGDLSKAPMPDLPEK